MLLLVAVVLSFQKFIVLLCLEIQHIPSELHAGVTIRRYPCICWLPAISACTNAATSSKFVVFASQFSAQSLQSPILISALFMHWKRDNFFVIKASSEMQFYQFIDTRHFVEADICSFWHTVVQHFPNFDFIFKTLSLFIKVHNNKKTLPPLILFFWSLALMLVFKSAVFKPLWCNLPRRPLDGSNVALGHMLNGRIFQFTS